jgi:rhodanese-related sulfurtransferase
MAIAALSGAGGAQTPANINSATLAETGQKAAEVSTEQLQRILQEKSAVIFDVRPFREFALGHSPGALNVAAKPGVPISLYVSDVAEIGRVLKGDKARPIVIYCNGPFCGKSKRTAAELLEAGFTDVRRYQLGIPVWRALGGVTQIEPEGARHVLANDRTAVFIDARDAQDFKAASISGAKNLPQSGLKPGKDVGEVKAAKDDGRLPMEDHNARIVVFGIDGSNARFVADAISLEAFHNVSFIDAPFEQVKRTLRQK